MLCSCADSMSHPNVRVHFRKAASGFLSSISQICTCPLLTASAKFKLTLEHRSAASYSRAPWTHTAAQRKAVLFTFFLTIGTYTCLCTTRSSYCTAPSSTAPTLSLPEASGLLTFDTFTPSYWNTRSRIPTTIWGSTLMVTIPPGLLNCELILCSLDPGFHRQLY